MDLARIKEHWNHEGSLFHSEQEWLIAEVERLKKSASETVEEDLAIIWNLTVERDNALASLTLSRAEGKREGMEAAAKIVESECARVLALQTGKQDDLNRGVDQNVRMIAVLLPDIAAAIREAAQEGKE